MEESGLQMYKVLGLFYSILIHIKPSTGRKHVPCVEQFERSFLGDGVQSLDVDCNNMPSSRFS